MPPDSSQDSGTVYEVWARNASVGRVLVSTYEDRDAAVCRLEGLRAAQRANAFGAAVWIVVDGEVWNPDDA